MYSQGDIFSPQTPLGIRKIVNGVLNTIEQKSITIANEFNNVMFTYFNPVHNPNLYCKEWFQYAVDTLFGCSKGRLMQISGTCYLNAIINGLVLSKPVRNLLLDKMKKLKHLEFKTSLSREGLSRACRDAKTDDYIFKLLYNVLCSNTPLKKVIAPEDDLIIQYSKKYSIPDIYTGIRTGEGGLSDETMRQMVEYLNVLFGTNVFFSTSIPPPSTRSRSRLKSPYTRPQIVFWNVNGSSIYESNICTTICHNKTKKYVFR